MRFINYVLRRMVHHLGNILRFTRINWLRLIGVKIGKNCMLSMRAKIDTRRGTVIIGDDCTITYGCVILSHDGAAGQINPEDDGEGRVIISDNVFIGVNSVILRNVTIGKNSVIGAGSVVTTDIPPNVLALGNPARVVKEIKPQD